MPCVGAGNLAAADNSDVLPGSTQDCAVPEMAAGETEDLIVTLESPTARQRRTDNLRTLIETRNQNEITFFLVETLPINEVSRFDDSAVVIRARVITRAHDKWRVSREYNRCFKLAFDQGRY